MSLPALDSLVEELRLQISTYLSLRCNRLPLGKRPAELRQVYVDTYLSWENQWQKGLYVVSTCPHLLVKGLPGAGKTTFLQYVTLQVCDGNLYPDRIPLWIDLQELEVQQQGLVPYILQQVASFWRQRSWIIRKTSWQEESNLQPDVEIDIDIGQFLLHEGRFFLVLDHLDRVSFYRLPQVIAQITDLLDRHPQNAMLLSCRSGEDTHGLLSFQQATIADFGIQQVTQFFEHYGQEKATALLKKWQSKEQASLPLWLQWICAEEEEVVLLENAMHHALYQQRSEFLGEGDARKLLEFLALQGLEREERVWNSLALQIDIHQFLREYPPLQYADPHLLIHALVVDYGILMASGKQTYCFIYSQLQDYLCAHKLAKSTLPDRDDFVLGFLDQPGWQGVLSCFIQLLPHPEPFFCKWLQKINLLVEEPIFQGLLQWIHESSQELQSSYRAVTIRAMYLDIDFEYMRHLDRKRALDLAHARTVDRARQRALGKELDMDTQVDIDYALTLALNLDLALYFKSQILLELAMRLDACLCETLEALRQEVPDPKSDSRRFVKWWQMHGMEWSKKLRDATLQHRRNARDFDLQEEHRQQLRKYYTANLFFIDCLNKHPSFTPPERRRIEDSIILPKELTLTVLGVAS